MQSQDRQQQMPSLKQLEALRNEVVKFNQIGMELYELQEFLPASFHFNEALNILLKIADESQKQKNPSTLPHARSKEPSMAPNINHSLRRSLLQPLSVDPSVALTESQDWSLVYALTVLHNSALTHYAMGCLDKAEKLLLLAVKLLHDDEEESELEGRDTLRIDPDLCVLIMSIYHTLGTVLSYMETESLVQEAMECFVEAANIGMEQLGEHVLVACVFVSMGRVLVREGYVREASGAYSMASSLYGTLQAYSDTGTVFEVGCHGAAAA